MHVDSPPYVSWVNAGFVAVYLAAMQQMACRSTFSQMPDVQACNMSQLIAMHRLCMCQLCSSRVHQLFSYNALIRYYHVRYMQRADWSSTVAGCINVDLAPGTFYIAVSNKLP